MRDRSKLLNYGVRQMCKSMLLEKQWRGTDDSAGNARFYLVVSSTRRPLMRGSCEARCGNARSCPAKRSIFGCRRGRQRRVVGLQAQRDALWLRGVAGCVESTSASVQVTMIPTQVTGARRLSDAGEDGVHLDGRGHEAFKLGVPVDAFLACFKPWVLDCSTARDERGGTHLRRPGSRRRPRRRLSRRRKPRRPPGTTATPTTRRRRAGVGWGKM